MKGNLLLGTARGRMGDLVAKVVHGKQVLAKYQPNVTNPRTRKQIENRETFSKASKIMQEIRKNFTSRGIHASYSTYSGASKSLQNVVIPYAFLHKKIYDRDGSGIPLVSKPPLLNFSETGQAWRLAWDTDKLDLILTMDGYEEGVQYFGSDIEIPNNELIGFILASSDDEMPILSTMKTQNISIIKEAVEDNIGVSKGYGFKSDISEVGEWNFIYKKTVLQLGAIVRKMPYVQGFNQEACIATIYTTDGRVMFAGSFSDLKVTP